ncbi:MULTISPECIES: ATP-dependent DNA helicase [Pasteurellaceae]|uniref:ATP-dependent DNA helicase YoaA n=1 Tax=Pasteurella atlantica TaxID=2827233 RepID=A0AAW8CQB3_9PAST|nr:ATP-dependent DNA helicase [Pasteurella atlantica]MBR0574492.1 ATP-dependent DNA helicase [Pasteurella atlantica]MDP8040369.1 ATP-dependent DNA helicase [Pasteurella atlantica]MDP8042420.1 ATP-dependent DNA helicase [Pasteurella atlantica]MDP8044639.1 ATP-dependent DNA helicase [Pasteurella atlantica]MDP8046678.1 ATP-dependent DNA helicase [Pasteurella atlantica]
MKLEQKIIESFDANGVLSKNIKGFSPRDAQSKMAKLVGVAITYKNSVVVEAGTGTGKTFAYLVPALLSKKKTIISTGSKNLQDQLFNRDLPTIQKALNYTGKIALLKGRANYLCLDRLDQLIAMGVAGDRSVLADLSKVRKWQTATKTGDLTECISIAEDSPILPQLVSTTDNCLGSDCPQFKECYVVKARQKAMSSDIVVVNHHLFCADMAVKETGFGELIPEAELVIFDEAHQLPDIASQYFGKSLTSRQLLDICKDSNIVYRTELKDAKQLGTASDHLQKVVQDFRLLLGGITVKGNLRDLFKNQQVTSGLNKLIENIEFLSEVVKKSLGRSDTLDKIFERLAEVKNFLKAISDTSVTGYCYWYEGNGRYFGLHITPLTVADKFGDRLNLQKIGWVFTSATLEVGGKFDHFCQRLGIESAHKMILQSPFDYQQQSLLCVPRYLPATNRNNTLSELGKMLQPVIEANKGRCFLLCTSYFMMRGLADFLRENSNLNVLLQGETSKSELLEQFTKKKHSVLVATQSFWEGIDVRGDALSLVIIDKLPFSSPDEPLLKARMEDCQLQGGNPFNDIQIPEAVITLKQGVGRLIRGIKDRGVILICDSRLVNRQYGATFLKSLPRSKRTRDLQKVVNFLKNKR